jgi:hypothetical protein
MLREDNETFRVSVVDATNEAGKVDWKPVWKSLSLRELTAGLDDETLLPDCRKFLLATAALISGESHQRRTLMRVTAPGTRNILVNVLTAAEYIEETFYPGEGVERRRERRRTKSVDNDFARILGLVSELLPPIKRELGFPVPEMNPSEFTFTIPQGVIDHVKDVACKEYLMKVGTGRLLTIPQIAKLQTRLERDWPDEADDIAFAIAKTQSREHLSAMSLSTSKDGHRVVSVVNVRGDMVALEDWKFLQLIRRHGESLSLGQVDRRGGWLPEPVLKFNDNKVGEVIGRYTANDSTLHMRCRKDTAIGSGRIKTDPVDHANFVIDQDYLVCLFIAISQLREQAARFDQLREQAEVKMPLRVETLFDDAYFDMIDQEERQ